MTFKLPVVTVDTIVEHNAIMKATGNAYGVYESEIAKITEENEQVGLLISGLFEAGGKGSALEQSAIFMAGLYVLLRLQGEKDAKRIEEPASNMTGRCRKHQPAVSTGDSPK